MYITQSFKYELNEIVYVSGTLPEGATLIETMDILKSEDGFDLIRNSDDENMSSSVWLRNGDSQDNYHEDKHIEESMEERIMQDIKKTLEYQNNQLDSES